MIPHSALYKRVPINLYKRAPCFLTFSLAFKPTLPPFLEDRAIIHLFIPSQNILPLTRHHQAHKFILSAREISSPPQAQSFLKWPLLSCFLWLTSCQVLSRQRKSFHYLGIEISGSKLFVGQDST